MNINDVVIVVVVGGGGVIVIVNILDVIFSSFLLFVSVDVVMTRLRLMYAKSKSAKPFSIFKYNSFIQIQ